MQPFHLAFPVHDLNIAKNFYTNFLNCKIGRYSDEWIDFNLFGHQIVAHLDKNMKINEKNNNVDGKEVPLRHFGIIMKWEDWSVFANELKQKNINFLIEPYTRFKGKPGEQATMFFKDPSGNALEFKSFKNSKMIFKAE